MSADNRTHRELMSAEWSARLIVVFLGLPSLGFAIVSGMFNAAYAARLGNSEHEQAVWVTASILITAFVTGLPLAIEILRQRVPHLAFAARMLWLASMAFSFIAALGYAAATRGESTAQTASAIGNRAAIERSIARGENELAALPRHRPANTVRGELRVAEASAGLNCSKAKSRNAREICQPVFVLQSELAAAEDAVRIEANIAHQRAQLNGVAVVGSSANPQADVLEWIGAGVLSASNWERVLTVFVAGLIEISAALGLAITARSVVELMAPSPMPVVEAVKEVVEDEPERIELAPSPLAAVDPELSWKMWFESCVTAQRGGKITPKDAYEHYERWASLNNVSGTLPYVTFGRRMTEAVNALGGKVGRSAGRYYADVSMTKLGMNGVPLVERDKEAAE